jgi:NAD(P)-dependent dehydrogenase (short-subunit alcohol dehydrogenase family)
MHPALCAPMTKVLLVTGASRGIGAATARLAAERGYAVCINYRTREQEALQLVHDIERNGGRAISARADVSVEADVVRLFDSTEAQLGPLSALVNNAGILERQMRVEAMTADRLARVFATNVIGAFMCAREAVRRMSGHCRGGAIVNLSSMAARLGSPDEYVDYAASKGAIDTFTIGLAKEVAAQKIRVNAVRPGLIDTEMHASGGEPGRIARLKSSVPMQRGGKAEEVAHAILWLLSDEAAYVTGSFIDVSGGR